MEERARYTKNNDETRGNKYRELGRRDGRKYSYEKGEIKYKKKVF